jgi:hypothetical protein
MAFLKNKQEDMTHEEISAPLLKNVTASYHHETLPQMTFNG